MTTEYKFNSTGRMVFLNSLDKPLSKKVILESFQKKRAYDIELLNLLFPELVYIKEIVGRPTVSRITNEFILNLSIEYDKKANIEGVLREGDSYEPRIPGDFWKKYGFETNEQMSDWKGNRSNCIVILKEDHNE